MKAFNGYDEAKINKGGEFHILPKGAYVLKVLNVKEELNKAGSKTSSRFDIAFDIAEGEYQDFYMKQYEARKAEDENAKYSNDAILRLSIPEDDSEGWIKSNFRTFTNALEESNDGYRWDWDENKWKGLLFGGLFRNEQSEYNGTVYDHTRLMWFRGAEDIRMEKYGQLPKDKLIETKSGSNDTDYGFVNVPAGSKEDLPFG